MTPERERALPTVPTSVCSHIAESDLTEFMLGEEGTSVFRAWSTKGFTSEQVERLYGPAVLEAFEATQLMLAYDSGM